MHMKPRHRIRRWMRLEILETVKQGRGLEVNTLAALSNLSFDKEHYEDTIFDLGETVKVTQCGHEIHFPRPLHRENHRGILRGYLTGLSAKYQRDGEFEVEPGDIVVDCGAYVGGFARSVVEIAERVVLIEPAPANYRCCQLNLAQFDNATVLNCGLFNETGVMPLNLSGSDVDHSFITPDQKGTGKTFEVPILRLDDLAKQQNLPRIDFWKLEAEGVEIEAIQGMGDMLPRKISIDTSPERMGMSPEKELTELLQAKGYDISTSENALRARLREG
ncbi:MAG: FkbM family methyltransferase [Pikeienuella sp.]